MNKYEGVKINQAQYDLANGHKGRVAVILYSGTGDPKPILDAVISNYVENEGYHELIDSNLDNPWMRVILSDINNMHQEDYDPIHHKIRT